MVGLRACAAQAVNGIGFVFGLELAAATLGVVPQTPLVCDRVDVLELNRVYDDRGQPVLTQMIFWDWHERDARLHVVAWRLWKNEDVHPIRDWARGDYVLLWHDSQMLREVRAAAWHESWTQFDPEMENRQRLPKSARRGLSLDSPLSGVKPSALQPTVP